VGLVKPDKAGVPWAKGLKRTRQRELVLGVLEQADAPLAAPDIAARLERQGESLWLSTIYRVLDSFVEHGMLSKAAVLDSGMAVYALSSRQHRHYAVCLACNRVIPLESCPLESVTPQLTEQNFQITGHRLQMYGFCGGCKPEQADDNNTKE